MHIVWVLNLTLRAQGLISTTLSCIHVKPKYIFEANLAGISGLNAIAKYLKNTVLSYILYTKL